MRLNNPPPIATNSTLGVVKPDGSTITISAGGVISSSGSSGGASWIQYVTGYQASTPPTVNSTIASGTVYNYTYSNGIGGTIVYYRLVPVNSSYTDAFYTTFSGGVLSGLIVSKGITV